MYKEGKYEKLLIGHIFEITDSSEGTQETSSMIKRNFRVSDDAVSGLRPTLCDVSSDLTDEDMAG